MAVKPSKISIFSVIWFVPIVAVLIMLWLTYDYYRSLGTAITLHISNAEGLEVENTVLKVLNVEVGRIKSIKLAADGKDVLMTAYVNSDNPSLLAKDTQYWVVKPLLTKGGVSGLSTLISGSYIGVLPGKSKEKRKDFLVSDHPPSIAYRTQGKMLQLVGEDNDTLLAPGSAVLYHGINVGTVDYSYFDVKDKKAHYQIFISSPNDQLLGTNIRFWIEFGVSLNTSEGSIQFKGLNFDNLLGSIAFSEPKGEGRGEPVHENQQFPVYANELRVPASIPKEAYHLVGFFNQGIKNLSKGAMVEYKGVQVGRIEQVPYYAAGDKAHMFSIKSIPVLFYIDPGALDSSGGKAFRKEIDQALSRGLVATIASGNLIMGGQYISLYEKLASESINYPRERYQNIRVIPTTITGLDHLTENINQLLSKLHGQTVHKLNHDLDEIASTLHSVRTLINSLGQRDVVGKIEQSVQQLNVSLKSLSPGSELYRNISGLLQQLKELSRNVNNKTNSLFIFKNAVDPVPGKVR
ncbi:MAG: MlaD family protein [Neisseriaceae bacterium]